MRKTLAILAILTLAQTLHAGHRRYFRSADDINSGTLDPARLNASSVTMLGPTIELSEIAGTPGKIQTDVYVGSLTAIGVDIQADNAILAIQAAYNRAGGVGLPESSTTQMRILFQPGNYIVPVASTLTVPVGVQILGIVNSTSVVFVSTSPTGNLFKIHGRMSGINFDFADNSIKGLAVNVCSGTFENSLIMRTSLHASGGNGEAPLGVLNSTGARISNVTFQVAREISNYQNGAGAIMVKNSTDTILDNITVLSVTNAFGGGGVVSTVNADRTIIKNSFFPQCFSGFLTIGASRNTKILNNVFITTGGATASNPGSAILLQTYLNTAMYVGSFTVISGNQFHNYNPNAGTVLITTVDPQLIFGTVIRDNEAMNYLGAPVGVTFFKAIGTATRNTVLMGNTVNGMTFISDSGVGTKYTGNDNFTNSVEE